MAGLKRARRVEPAVAATLSTTLDAVLTKRGASLLRSGAVTYLNDDEMDRLAEEWRRFRASSADGQLVDHLAT